MIAKFREIATVENEKFVGRDQTILVEGVNKIKSILLIFFYIHLMLCKNT